MALKYRIYKTSAGVSAGNIETIDDAAPTIIKRGISLETAVSFNYDTTSGKISIYYIGTNVPVISAGSISYSDIWDGTDTPMASLDAAVDYLNTVFTEPASGGGGGGNASAANQINGQQKTQVVDVSGTPLTVEADGSINVNPKGTQLASVVNVLPFQADAMQQSNPDINGNYQTIEYFQGGLSGTLVKTITLTFDANGGVITYVEA